MSDTKINWNRTTATTWTAKAHRGYTASIAYSASGYTLTIVGSGAPSDVAYTTLKLAKNAFRKFLFSK